MIDLRRCAIAIAVCCGALCVAAGVSAQEPKRNQVALDLSVLGGDLSYARHTGERTMLGFTFGLAGDWIALQSFSDEHFKDDGRVFGFVHGGGFMRRQLGERAEADFGVRGGLVIHATDRDDDVAVAIAGGPYATVLVGWRAVKFGPRVQAMYVYESGDAKGLGFVVDPITARVTLRF